MTALYVILGIIAFFVILLSIKIAVTVHYEDDVAVSIKWLFLKINVLPAKAKDAHKEKPKKDKKKKKKKEEEPKEESEIVKEPKKKKGDNMFVRFYKNRGVSGVVQLLKDAVKALGGMFGRIFKAFRIEELYIAMTVGAGEAADTAIQYSKTCAAAFPAMGLLVNKLKIKKYSIDISPDFIYGNNVARVHTKISFRPIKLINAVFVLVFELLFKVVFKLLKHSKAPEEHKVEKQIKK
ncbi:MAG: DUF2953 domain-containing protein [Clostridia bacterium]|nr:DUF2953 domain-containing protein [Clostridia bacterium]